MPLASGAGGHRLGIIAGSGYLPHFVAEAARRAGENPFIMALSNEADQTWDDFDHAVIGVGDMAGLARLLKRHDIGRVVMSGAAASTAAR